MEITIKSITDNEITLEGYGVIFDTVDLHDESFTKTTDFMLENVKAVPFLWEHNLDGPGDILGFAKPTKTDDVGILFEINLRRSNQYVEMVRRFVEKGRLGLSTGALPQTMQRDGKEIKRWQICELSGTVTPAEFRTLGVSEVKAIEDLLLQSNEAESSEKGDEPEELPIENSGSGVEIQEIKGIVEEKMAEENVAQATNDGSDVLKAQLDAVTKRLEAVMNVLESTPAAKAGYVTADGGKADSNIKSFGDWLMAVKRGDVTRLTSVYNSTKDLGEGTGSGGGFLVPTEYATSLLQVANMQNAVYSRVQKIPVGVESGTYPALDQYVTPTAGVGQTAGAAGVTAAFTQAGTTFTETEPKFSMLQWRVTKVGGMTEVENELIEDSPFAIEALLRGLFAVAIAAKNERNILRGTGVGEPLGILNAPAAIGISDSTTSNFKWADVAAMYARFKGVGGQPTWIIHPSVWPQIMVMANGTDNVWQANIQQGPTNVLNGYPIIVSEHLPQLGNTGSVLLADLSGYLMFERAGLSIAYSSEVGFTRDVGTWRFRQRNDGKPWLLNTIKLSDPQGSYSVSPFLYLVND